MRFLLGHKPVSNKCQRGTESKTSGSWLYYFHNLFKKLVLSKGVTTMMRIQLCYLVRGKYFLAKVLFDASIIAQGWPILQEWILSIDKKYNFTMGLSWEPL